jgi:pyruvate/2-oxoglutarate dehydrogenase complex dihydrolipoamide dehydrogenase (E3) component
LKKLNSICIIRNCSFNLFRGIENAQRAKEEQMEKQLTEMEIPIIRGIGKFLDKNHVEVTLHDGGVIKIEADYFVISTGSTPREPPDMHVDKTHILTSDHIQLLKDFPKSLVIVRKLISA